YWSSAFWLRVACRSAAAICSRKLPQAPRAACVSIMTGSSSINNAGTLSMGQQTMGNEDVIGGNADRTLGTSRLVDSLKQ
ncbi:Uncharacterized protein DAT39_005760, partial [Clarias magur]